MKTNEIPLSPCALFQSPLKHSDLTAGVLVVAAGDLLPYAGCVEQSRDDGVNKLGRFRVDDDADLLRHEWSFASIGPDLVMLAAESHQVIGVVLRFRVLTKLQDVVHFARCGHAVFSEAINAKGTLREVTLPSPPPAGVIAALAG